MDLVDKEPPSYNIYSTRESYGGMGRHFVSAGSANIRRFTDEQGSHVLAA